MPATIKWSRLNDGCFSFMAMTRRNNAINKTAAIIAGAITYYTSLCTRSFIATATMPDALSGRTYKALRSIEASWLGGILTDSFLLALHRDARKRLTKHVATKALVWLKNHAAQCALATTRNNAGDAILLAPVMTGAILPRYTGGKHMIELRSISINR